MAWSAPMTYTDATALTAAQLNAFLRDNLNETMVAKATVPGSIFVTTDTNQLTERTPAQASIQSAEGTTSTAYGDLNTYGPSVSVQTGESAIVIVSALMWGNTVNIDMWMSFEAMGASDLAAADANAWMVSGVAAWQPWRGSMINFITTLTPGLNVFNAKYRVGSHGATFTDRTILVIPQ